MKMPTDSTMSAHLEAHLELERFGATQIADRCAIARRVLYCTTVGDSRDSNAFEPYDNACPPSSIMPPTRPNPRG